jgi:signal transduction histidine kinase
MTKSSEGEWEKKYATALRTYLQGGGEAALQKGYELGRRALAEGLGVLKMIDLHHLSLGKLLPELLKGREPAEELVRQAGEFFAESMSSFEMTHRAFDDANNALRHINEILEDEIKRIAQSLHDESSQLLVATRIELDGIARQLPAELNEHVNKLGERLDQVQEQLRRLSHELRPAILDDLGLVPALEFLAAGVCARTGLHITVDGPKTGRLPPRMEIALYRIVQEALNNTSKHAHASRVQIRMRRRGKLVQCVVQDDGLGFNSTAVLASTNRAGLGLKGIRERVQSLGGNLEICAAPRAGTALQIQLPFEAHT